MISVTLTNSMLNKIISIEGCRSSFSGERVASVLSDKMRKNSKRKSSYASTKIEGNPLTESQAESVIDEGRRHFLKPEQEVRNYYSALTLLDKALAEQLPLDKPLILDVQREVVAGESAEKAGFRKPMPPGVLFAVYDSVTGKPDYIPPDAAEVEGLLDEMVAYVAQSDDHPLVKAGVIHYQLATIHPFEDGNGRTARLMSGYYLDLCGFGFGGFGSLEEYFAYDVDEYYRSLQMGLPVLYYEGRDDPPHPEIWVDYFLRMVELYAKRTCELAESSANDQLEASLSHLKRREREFLERLLRDNVDEFTPIEMARAIGVSNRTIINWSAALVSCGLLVPNLVNQRIRSYSLTDFARQARES